MFSHNFARKIMSDIPYQKSQNKAPIQRKIHQLSTPKENCKSLSISSKDARRVVFGLLTCWSKYHVVLSCGGIGQFNCDNRPQQQSKPHMEASILSVLHVPHEKYPTESGVIPGKSYSHQMILETEQVLFRAHVHSLDRRSRNTYDHLE